MLDDFSDRYRELDESILSIKREARSADWNTPLDVKKTFRGARTPRGGFIVLNIRGGHYRLVAKVNYRMKTVEFRFIGTHAEYDRFRKRGGLTP